LRHIRRVCLRIRFVGGRGGGGRVGLDDSFFRQGHFDTLFSTFNGAGAVVVPFGCWEDDGIFLDDLSHDLCRHFPFSFEDGGQVSERDNVELIAPTPPGTQAVAEEHPRDCARLKLATCVIDWGREEVHKATERELQAFEMPLFVAAIPWAISVSVDGDIVSNAPVFHGVRPERGREPCLEQRRTCSFQGGSNSTFGNAIGLRLARSGGVKVPSAPFGSTQELWGVVTVELSDDAFPPGKVHHGRLRMALTFVWQGVCVHPLGSDIFDDHGCSFRAVVGIQLTDHYVICSDQVAKLLWCVLRGQFLAPAGPGRQFGALAHWAVGVLRVMCHEVSQRRCLGHQVTVTLPYSLYLR
jgi:hypothetical protein